MSRRAIDRLACWGGAAMLALFIAIGALALWGYSYANGTVHNQLAAQHITFPSQAAFAHAKPGTEITPSMIPSVSQYAGQQLVNGTQAEVYANDFIAVHLAEMGNGKTYSQLSAAAMALPKGSAAYTKAEAVVQTVFQGTTLRSMLLQAYAFWLIGQIALWAGVAAFALAGVMFILIGLGVVHARRTPAHEEVRYLVPATVAA